MPLKRGHDDATVAANIREMVKAGHPKDQAVAAAMRMKRESEANKHRHGREMNTRMRGG